MQHLVERDTGGIEADARLRKQLDAWPCAVVTACEQQVEMRRSTRHVTDWRMHIAEELLATTHEGVAAISRRVGYDSEEAFSRAFKRSKGAPPGAWRASRDA